MHTQIYAILDLKPKQIYYIVNAIERGLTYVNDGQRVARLNTF